MDVVPEEVAMPCQASSVVPLPPVVVYGSAIGFDDVGLAYGDMSDASGGQTRGVTRATEELFRVVSGPEPGTVEVVRVHGGWGQGEVMGGCDGGDEYEDDDCEEDDCEEDALLMEMARMGLPTGFGKPSGRRGGRGGDSHLGESAASGSSRSHVRFMDVEGTEREGGEGEEGEEGEGGEGGRARGRRTVKVKKKRKNPKKYWLQRYSLFSLYDKGIQIDDEGWYSVTPEVIAWHHASMIVRANGRGCVVYDVFGGVGGNAIQLALAGCHVIVTEICPDKAYMIRNNARVYGVQERVDVLIGDASEVASRLRPGLIDAVLLSPPWGGPDYAKGNCLFDVQQMGGYPELGVGALLQMAFGTLGVSSAVLWLPRTSDLQQLGVEVARLGRERRVNCHVELARINNVDKAITVYLGAAQKQLDAEYAGQNVQPCGHERNQSGHRAIINSTMGRAASDIASLVGKLHVQSSSFV